MSKFDLQYHVKMMMHLHELGRELKAEILFLDTEIRFKLPQGTDLRVSFKSNTITAVEFQRSLTDHFNMASYIAGYRHDKELATYEALKLVAEELEEALDRLGSGDYELRNLVAALKEYGSVTDEDVANKYEVEE